MSSNRLTKIIITDCGSTTSAAILIEYVDGEYRQKNEQEDIDE